MGSSGSKLSSQDLAHLKKVTNYPPKQLKNGYKLFHFINPDGLTEAEFIEQSKPSEMELVLGGSEDQPIKVIHRSADAAEDFLRLIFQSFGKDRATYVDITATRYLMSSGTMKECVAASFKIYDRKKNGNLTYDDIMLVQKAIDRMNMVGVPKEQPDPEAPVEETADDRCPRFFQLAFKEPPETINFEDFKLLALKDPRILVFKPKK